MSGRAGVERAVRATLAGTAPGLREAVIAAAAEAGVLGWVRHDDDGFVRAHAEGDAVAIDAVLGVLERLAGTPVTVAEVKPEGHEQFAVRGVSAGIFIVIEVAGGYEMGLELDGALRSWRLPKGPSMDPAVKRMAIAVAGSGLAADESAASCWDRGYYEQGGRVGWPEAIERGHAVFVLHGERLRGGFALQRTGGGTSPRWLLIKRRDDEARPGSDVVAEAER